MLPAEHYGDFIVPSYLIEEEDAETVVDLVEQVVSQIRKDKKIPIMLGDGEIIAFYEDNGIKIDKLK